MKCRDIGNAEKLFERMKRDVISYGLMMKMYNESNQSEKCLSLFERMKSEKIEPNEIIHVLMINAHLQLNQFDQARSILENAKTNTTVMYNALLNGKSSRLIHTFIDSFRLGFAEHRQGQAGIDLFRRMNIPSNEYTFTIMFKICAQLTDDASLELGHKMLKSLPDNYRRNTVVLNAALHMLMQRGQISAGEQLFNQMDKDNITHGTMMSGKITAHEMFFGNFSSLGFLANDKPQKAIDLFHRIERPDAVDFRVFFQACGQLGSKEALAMAKRVICQSLTQGSQKDIESRVSITILDMFIKCRDMESAEKLFDRMKPSVVSYGVMMKMYNDNKQSEKCLMLFEQMQSEKIEPNEMIYLCIINACSQIGHLSICDYVVSQLPQSARTNLKIQTGLIDMWVSAKTELRDNE